VLVSLKNGTQKLAQEQVGSELCHALHTLEESIVQVDGLRTLEQLCLFDLAAKSASKKDSRSSTFPVAFSPINVFCRH